MLLPTALLLDAPALVPTPDDDLLPNVDVVLATSICTALVGLGIEG